MTALLRIPVCLLMAIATTASAQAPLTYSRARISLVARPDGLRELQTLGITLDHSSIEPGRGVLGEFSAYELDLVMQAGFSAEVLIEDLSDYYVQRARSSSGITKDFGTPGCPGTTSYAVPEHFTTGSMGGFHLWQEMQDQLDSMLVHFPDLISPKQSIGTSHEGRPLNMVRISNNPNVDQQKPEVLYDALHHAREPESATQLILYMWHLLENYGTDPVCTYLLDTRELYFVPCINPDGYVYNETTSPAGGGMWRKNRRDNGDGSFGVDLNRNYGYQWGINDVGSSPDPLSDTYRGPSAFSEPETQAMRDFIEEREFVTQFSHHCRGHFMIHAWGYGPAPCPDCDVMRAYAQRMGEDNGFVYGDTFGVLNYYANGSATDWSYGEHGMIGYVPETGTADDGFWPAPDRILPLALGNVEQNLMLALFAGPYAEAIDASPRAVDGLSPTAQFNVKRFGQASAACTVSIEPLLNVIDAGTPLVFPSLSELELAPGSIELVLDPGILEGERFRYVLVTECDGLVQRDTIERVHGAPTELLNEECSTDAAWAGSWGLDTDHWTSEPSGFSDSPFENYWDLSFTEWSLTAPLDLSQASSATLDLMAKWALQSELDHVRLEGSSDGFAWTALCGRYARQGFAGQGEGEPVYDGMRHDWTAERVVLDDFVGGPLHLRFSLTSNEWVNYDGFQIDDLVVTITGGEISAVADAIQPGSITVYPSPADENATIRFSVPTQAPGTRLSILDAHGRLVNETSLRSGQTQVMIDTRSLPTGIYSIAISTGDALLVQRLPIAH